MGAGFWGFGNPMTQATDVSMNELSSLREVILKDIESGAEFSDIAVQRRVTRSLVWALAYEPEKHSICSACKGCGNVQNQNMGVFVPCEGCRGSGSREAISI